MASPCSRFCLIPDQFSTEFPTARGALIWRKTASFPRKEKAGAISHICIRRCERHSFMISGSPRLCFTTGIRTGKKCQWWWSPAGGGFAGACRTAGRIAQFWWVGLKMKSMLPDAFPAAAAGRIAQAGAGEFPTPCLLHRLLLARPYINAWTRKATVALGTFSAAGCLCAGRTCWRGYYLKV